jgi:hypothetical protein
MVLWPSEWFPGRNESSVKSAADLPVAVSIFWTSLWLSLYAAAPPNNRSMVGPIHNHLAQSSLYHMNGVRQQKNHRLPGPKAHRTERMEN